MTDFESEGQFWLPVNPEQTQVGRLQWKKDGSSELSISGALNRERHDLEEPYPVVHGVVEKTPASFGRAVTLWNSYLVGQTHSSTGLTRARYRPQILLSGLHLEGEDRATFSAAELRYSSLDEWAERFTGLSQPDRVKGGKFIFGCRYETPDKLTMSCRAATLNLHTTATTHQRRRRYEIVESVTLEVLPSSTMRLSELNDQFVYPLQNFFTFAMNHPAALERWVNRVPGGDSTEGTDSVDVNYPRYFSGPNPDEDSSYFPLFYLEHVRDRLQSVFSAWLDASDRLGDALSLYFGVQYSKKMFTDWRFQTILHALTVYGQTHERKQSRDTKLNSILASVEPEEAQYLTKLLATSLLLNAENVLLDLMEAHGSEVEWLFGRPSTAFVARVTNTLHYLMHRDPVNSFAASQGETLYYLTETLGWLMKLCLLKEIGFSKEERKKLIERHQVAQHLRTNNAKYSTA